MTNDYNHPYPGLRPFQKDEANIFCGREEELERLLQKLGEAKFLAILGTSGCGKSSLVNVGFLSNLHAGLFYGHHWHVASFRPGNTPFRYLAEALPKNTPLHGQDLEERLRRDKSLNNLLAETPLNENYNLLILVDQFEELFRYSQPPGEVESFIDWLLQSCQHQHEKVYVAIAMRSEFMDKCHQFYKLSQAISQGLFLIPPFTQEQLQQAIEGPARVFGGQVEPELVKRLLHDLEGKPDCLPLMQHTLVQMWPHGERGINLTLEGYKKVGGVEKAIANTAEEVFSGLGEADKKIAEILFRNLTAFDKETKAYDMRNPIALKDVATLTGLTWQAASNIVDKFRERRRRFLIPLLYENTRLQENSLIDISHEALIRQWPRLTEWAKDEETLAKDYRRLAEEALLHKEGRGELWQGLNLHNARIWHENARQLYSTDKQLEVWTSRRAQRFDNPEHFKIAMAFLEASRKAYEEWKKSKAEEQQREQLLKETQLRESLQRKELEEVRLRDSLKQIKLQRWRLASVATAIGLILTTTVAIWGYWERNQALRAKQQVEQLEQTRTSELFESQRTHAELLAKEENYAQAKSTLDKTRELDQDIPVPRRHARDLLATLVNLRGGTTDKVYEGATAALSSLALSPNGQWIAAGGENGTLVLFDRNTKQIVHRLTGHTKNVRAVVFDTQNYWLLSGGDDGQIIQWSLPSGAKQHTWSTTAPVWALAVSADGKQLANSNGNEITLRFIDSDQTPPISPLKGHQDKVSSLAYDPTGKWLASGSYDHTIRLWQVDSGTLQHTLQGHADKVQNVLFHPDGKRLASSSTDKTIWLWNVETGQPVQILNGHQNAVFGLSFITPTNATGQSTLPALLASSSADRTVHLWDLDSGITLRVLQGHTAQVTGLTAQNMQLFTASNDGTIRQWDFSLPQQHFLPIGQEAASTAIAPDGKSVVVGLANGSLQSYALPTLELLWKQEKVHAKDLQRLTFSPDNHLLASASLDKTVKLWRVENNTIQLTKTFSDYQGGVNGLTFSPDSQYLVTASYDKRIGVFNLHTNQPPQWIDYEGEEVNSVVFDASGKQLLSAGDQTVRLWQFDQGKLTLLKSFPKEHDILWAALSSTGQQYTRVGRNLPVTVYSLPDGHQLHDLPGHENSVLRVFYTPDNQQLVTVGGDATIRFWDLTKNPGSELFTLPLPARPNPPAPVWDFDFRCTPTGCWIAVPLTRGQLVLYELGRLYE